MKKLTALILALVMCLSLCACGGSSEEGAATAPAAENTEGAKPEKGVNIAALGEEIVLDFVTMSFSSAEITYKVGGSGISRNAADGNRLFCLAGELENTGGSPLSVENTKVEMVFNGEYTYNGYAHLIDSKSFPASVSPLSKMGYWICAEVPEALLEKIQTCEVVFSFNDGFAATPESPKKGDNCYKIYLDEAACQAALEVTVSDFFKECPILPTPVNYAPMYQTGFSSSSSNGKTTSIKYSFSLISGRNDNVSDLYNDYLEELKKAGFTVEGDAIYSDGIKLATVKVNGSKVDFDIVPGNEMLAAPTAAGTPSQAAPAEESLEIGDTIETDYITVTLDETGTADQICSGTGSYGMYKYYESETGDPYFYITGSMKNTGGIPVDVYNIYIQFCFDGKYNYKGESVAVKADYGDFIDDLSPLASADYYFFAAVPSELINSYKSCEVRIGFTEDFAIKVVDTNDLPKFENCDDVFLVTVK